MLRDYLPGEWRSDTFRVDYRMERIGNMLVERATWGATAPQRELCQTLVAAPGYIWVRFWLLQAGAIVEKYYTEDAQSIGMYIPVCDAEMGTGDGLRATDLALAIWIGDEGQVTVLNESEFEAAIQCGDILATQAVEAEDRFRDLTRDIAQGLFPPAIIRNFALDLGQLK